MLAMFGILTLAALLALVRAMPDNSKAPDSSASSPTFQGSPQFVEAVNDVSRLFAFPSGKESRSRNPNLERLVEVPAPSSRHRQLAVFPSLNGLQVGLDFRLPFLNLPYSSVLSGLFRSGSFLGPAGQFFKVNLTSLALMAVIAIISILYYPQMLSMIGLIDSKETFRALNDFAVQDIMANVNRLLNSYNVEAETCMKMAICAAAKDNQRRKQNRTISFTLVDIVDSVMSLTGYDNTMMTKGISQARTFGETGGDCNIYNNGNKCPLNGDSWRFLMSKFNYSF